MNSLNQKSKDGMCCWTKEPNQTLHEGVPTQEDNIALLSEIIKGRLYFALLRTLHKPPCTKADHFFTTDHDFVYVPYNRDFGPLCLSSLIRYCCLIKRKLRCPSLLHKRIIHCTSLLTPQLRANASYLISAFAVLCLGRHPAAALAPLLPKSTQKNIQLPTLLPFRDASIGESSKTILLSDCLYALHFALSCGFFDPNDFDVEEYENFLNSNCNLNWIVPRRLLAFAGPQDTGYGFKPQNYVEYFKDNGVAAVVRLNHPMYNKSIFTNAGIYHIDWFFSDGTPPPHFVVKAFLKLCDEVEAGKWTLGIPGAIAVHCKAGLGRTGVLIASRLISRYGMRAKEAVAWLRICRPGSVMSCQQEWLENNEGFLLTRSANRILKNKQYVTDEPRPLHGKHFFGIYSIQEKLLTWKTEIEGERNTKALNSDSDECAKENGSEKNKEVLRTYDQGTSSTVKSNQVTTSLSHIKSDKKDEPKRAKIMKKGYQRKQLIRKRPHP